MTAPPLDPTGAEDRIRLVYVAAADAAEAERLAQAAVERKLAACASDWPIRSRYWWRGRIEHAGEHALLLKTSGKKLGALLRFLAREHSYEVPDLLEIKVPRAHEPYIQWLLASIDPALAGPPRAGSSRRRAARPARAVRGLRRTPAPRRRRY
ncbi:MAG TPA: divalent-cation tolerance protein CutA [Thermoplasmata archaeon]|nr:divalent-cation tolerance protein CutA [Thermoplasmata archaeon]